MSTVLESNRLQRVDFNFPQLVQEAHAIFSGAKRIKAFVMDSLETLKPKTAKVNDRVDMYNNGCFGYGEDINRFVSNICLEILNPHKCPPSRHLELESEMKTFFTRIKSPFEELQRNLARIESEKTRKNAEHEQACKQKKSELMANEQTETSQNSVFDVYLRILKEKFKDATKKPVYFAYAWPDDEYHHDEQWVQNFLTTLKKHLNRAGFHTISLDISSNEVGRNINKFMSKARDNGYVLLFGTKSLLLKHHRRISAVCTELIHIKRKVEEDDKQDLSRVLPILLSGDYENAFPAGYERYFTIREWRNKSYMGNFQAIFIRVLGGNFERHSPLLDKYWRKAIEQSNTSSEDLLNMSWYEEKRIEIEACRRAGDAAVLEKISITRESPPSLPSVQEIPLQSTFVQQGPLSTTESTPEALHQKGFNLEIDQLLPEALNYHLMAAEEGHGNPNKAGIARSYLHVCNVFHKRGERSKSERYLGKANEARTDRAGQDTRDS